MLFIYDRNKNNLQGSRYAHRVFTVTRDSQLLVPDTVNMILMSESDIVKQYGCQHDHDITHVYKQDSIIDGLFSYQVSKSTHVVSVGI